MFARAVQFNPIGHGVEWKLVRYAIDDLKNLIRAIDICTTPSQSLKLLLGSGAWDKLLDFLEGQLKPSFEAFRASDEWHTFDAPAAAGSTAAKPGALSTLQKAAAAADAADAGVGDDADKVGKMDKPAGASAADSYADYVPAKLTYGPPHVEHVVESASLACVSPTDITFELSLPESALSTPRMRLARCAHQWPRLLLPEGLGSSSGAGPLSLCVCVCGAASGVLSRVQLEAVVYALQQHERMLPSGHRAGFFIGDGTGVGKGRELAAIVWDNWRRSATKGRRSVWFTCNTDLAVDARRTVDAEE